MKVCFLVLLLAAGAFAQSNGYLYVAPGAATSHGYSQGTLQVGAGFEIGIYKGLAAGAEIGAITPWNYWSGVLGVVSPNGYYHFIRGREVHVDPFVTAGYTAFFRDGHLDLFNYGGGVNLWPLRHFGIRAEMRDQVTTQYTTVHYWGFRFGLAFR